MFSPDMSGNPYPVMGSGAVNDIADHEAMDMPEPGHSPAIQHSTKMAGTEIPGSLPNPFDDRGPITPIPDNAYPKPPRKPRKPK